MGGNNQGEKVLGAKQLGWKWFGGGNDLDSTQMMDGWGLLVEPFKKFYDTRY